MFQYCYLVQYKLKVQGDANVFSITLINGIKLFILELQVNFLVDMNVSTLNSLLKFGGYKLEFVSENPVGIKKLEEILTKKYI